jgi:hypothetical protein
MQILFSLVESPFHPNFAALYKRLGILETPFSSARNLHKVLHKQTPDFFVGDFIYGWANNYAGTNLSNLDVTLATLQRFAPKAKVIVFTQPGDEPHVLKLQELFDVHAVLRYSASEKEMQAVLELKPEAITSATD